MLEKNRVEYKDGNTLLEGYAVYDKDKTGKKPLVLVAHDWSGRNEFAEKKAEQLADLGYVGFALDMYGKGKLAKTKEEKTECITPFLTDRILLRERILAAFETAKKLPGVDASRIGAIGYCFGGLCVLDLARNGVDLKGIVSFHGLLNKPTYPTDKQIKAKMLILHGYEDPMASMEQVSEFEKEMSAANVDWQVHVYGKTMHAFTNPLANDPNFGTVFNELSAKRAWVSMKDFFHEIFA